VHIELMDFSMKSDEFEYRCLKRISTPCYRDKALQLPRSFCGQEDPAR
jgi:hypothetical protein